MNILELKKKFLISGRKLRFLFTAICLLLVIPLLSAQAVNAEKNSAGLLYTNPDTGFAVIAEDSAGLFEDSEIESEILPHMKEITAFGNVALITTDSNSESASHFARETYRECFGTDSGTLFLMDLSNRELYIFSDGAVYRTITKSTAYTITDNIYTYASDGDYVTCTAMAFSQIHDQLQGKAIAAPMRHISALLLAIGLGLLITFIWAKYDTITALESSYEVIKNQRSSRKISGPDRQLIHRYIHSTKLSDGRGSGSGSSGGGSSGGGGGHSF